MHLSSHKNKIKHIHFGVYSSFYRKWKLFVEPLKSNFNLNNQLRRIFMKDLKTISGMSMTSLTCRSLPSVQIKYCPIAQGLVDFAIGLVNSVFNLPDRQVMFYEESE